MDNRLVLPSFWIEDSPYDWDALKGLGEIQEFNKGHILFLEQETMDKVYLIKQGKVKLSISNQEGNEKTVGYLGKNSIVGTSSLFNDSKYMYNATVMQKSKLYIFNRDEFIEKILSNEKLTLQIFKIMSSRIRILTNHVLDLSYHHSFIRLANILIEISDTYGVVRSDSSILLNTKITQRELSEIIGTTLVTVANHLKKLIELEIIAKDQKHYVILNMDALQEIATQKEWS